MRGALPAIVILAAVGSARGEPLRPITTHLGWHLDLDTFVQLDAVPWSASSSDELSPSTGLPLNEQTLSIRRGLLRLIGTKDDFRVLAELDGDTVNGTPSARLFEAMIGWQPLEELVDVEAGLQQIPFGNATPTNARKRDFMEQPTFLRAFFPGDNDAGLLAKGAYGIARWSVAAMNGAPVGDAQWRGKDPSSSYDVIGRLGGELAVPEIYGRPHFVAGVSALTGSVLHPGTPQTKDQLVWIDENMDGLVQTTELQVIPGSSATPSQRFHHEALGADAAVSWCLQWAGQGTAFAEAALATNLDRAVYFADPVASARDIRELGFMVGAVQHVTPYALAGVRYDYYNADRDASAQLGTTLVGVDRVFSRWAFLAAGIYGNVRLSVEFDRSRNPFGLSDSGMPITRAEDRFVIRAQAEL